MSDLRPLPNGFRGQETDLSYEELSRIHGLIADAGEISGHRDKLTGLDLLLAGNALRELMARRHADESQMDQP